MRPSLASFFKKAPASELRFTFSTFLTLVRIFLTPCIVVAMFLGEWGVAFWLFFIASLTDMFDGMLARLLNQKTFLGACLDPLADKCLLVSCFAALACTDTLPFTVPFWFVMLVLFREIIIVAGFVYMYCTSQGLDVKPTFLGKGTTAAQMIFIMWLFTCYFYGWAPAKTYYTALCVITVMVVASLVQYALIGIRHCWGVPLQCHEEDTKCL